jgi:hypothetical protein
MRIQHAIYANAALVAILNQAAPAFAADDNAREQRNGRRGPPQVAIDACSSAAEGDSCSFTGRDDEQLSGTCFAPPERGLACKPEGHERRGGKNREQSGSERNSNSS